MLLTFLVPIFFSIGNITVFTKSCDQMPLSFNFLRVAAISTISFVCRYLKSSVGSSSIPVDFLFFTSFKLVLLQSLILVVFLSCILSNFYFHAFCLSLDIYKSFIYSSLVLLISSSLLTPLPQYLQFLSFWNILLS